MNLPGRAVAFKLLCVLITIIIIIDHEIVVQIPKCPLISQMGTLWDSYL